MIDRDFFRSSSTMHSSSAYFSFIRKKGITSIAFMVLLFGLASGIYLSLASQDTRQQAAEKMPGKMEKPSVMNFDRAKQTVKVLVVIYDPILKQQSGMTLREFRQWNDPMVFSPQIASTFDAVSHGRIHFEIVETITRNEWPLHTSGQRFTEQTYVLPPPDDPLGQTDWHAFINDNQIEQKINSGLIDEVWVWGAPNFAFGESIMAGNGAYEINATPPIQGIATKAFVIMGFNYETGIGNAIHSIAHRAESIMWRTYGSWEPNTSNDWSAFALVKNNAPGYEYSGCGNAHFPPNGVADYDYDNLAPASTYCDSFYNFPNYNTSERDTYTCQEWNPDCSVSGDSQFGYIQWWFNHFPHVDGIKTGYLNNWWRYVADPNQYRAKPTFFPLQSPDLTENNANQWLCWAEDATATCTNSTSHVKRGQYSLQFNTDGPFDTYVRYPQEANANINASSYDFLKFTAFSINESEDGFQNYSPRVYLKNSDGSYFKFTPSSEILNDSIQSDYQIAIPLGGDAVWQREVSGNPSLSDIDQIEIHMDTWGAGFTTYIDDLSFASANGTDSTPPAVTISAPPNGTLVSGNVAVMAQASDEHTVVYGTELYVDGQPTLSDTTAPFIMHWNANTVPAGSHVLTVKAYDAFGNESTSAPITINSNVIILPAPTNFHVSSTTTQATLTWTAVPGALHYQIERCSGVSCSNFTEIATDTASPFVDSGLTANAVYRYRIRANNGAPGTYTPAVASSVSWNITAVPVCANGTTPTQPVFLKHTMWPPDPLVWSYDTPAAGSHTLNLVSRNSMSSTYVQLSNAAVVLPPTGTPPSGITFGTYFSPPASMAKLSRSAPALPAGTYTLQYLAPASWCTPTPPTPSPTPIPSGTCTITGPNRVTYPGQATFTATFNFPGGNLDEAYIQVTPTDSSSNWTTVYTEANPGTSSWTATVPISFPYAGKQYYVACGALDTSGKICSANPWCEWEPNPPSSFTCSPNLYNCGSSDVITVISAPPASPNPGVFLNDGLNKNCNTVCQDHFLSCVDVGTDGSNNKGMFNNAQGQCVEASNITCSNYMDGNVNLNCTANGETHKVDWTYCTCN